MPVFRISQNMKSQVWAWDLHRFEVVRSTPSAIAMRWDTDDRDYDPVRYPWRVKLEIEDGVVDGFTYFNKGGRVIATLSDIALEADLVRLMLAPEIDNARSLFGMAVAPGGTFVGGRQSNARFDRSDDLTTGSGDDIVLARSGNDYIKDHGGSDIYRGGSGSDTVTYDQWFWDDADRVVRGIEADLRAGWIIGPDGARDKVVSIEGVRGSFLDDVIRGNGGDNYFQGEMGDDLIDGRRGRDMVSYRGDAEKGGDSGVLVRLDRGFAIDGFGDRDRLRSIEQAQGSDFDDRLFDKFGQSYLDGRDGDDRLFFSRGYDAGRGGDGADMFIMRGQTFDEVYIQDFDPGEGDRLRFWAYDDDALTTRVEKGDTIVETPGGNVILAGYTGDVFDFTL